MIEKEIKSETNEDSKNKVVCFVSKKMVDIKETVEVDYKGQKVRVHKKYLNQSN